MNWRYSGIVSLAGGQLFRLSGVAAFDPFGLGRLLTGGWLIDDISRAGRHFGGPVPFAIGQRPGLSIFSAGRPPVSKLTSTNARVSIWSGVLSRRMVARL